MQLESTGLSFFWFYPVFITNPGNQSKPPVHQAVELVIISQSSYGSGSSASGKTSYESPDFFKINMESPFPGRFILQKRQATFFSNWRAQLR
jgi:hypothetical protein